LHNLISRNSVAQLLQTDLLQTDFIPDRFIPDRFYSRPILLQTDLFQTDFIPSDHVNFSVSRKHLITAHEGGG
jgi:hypothetical protein